MSELKGQVLGIILVLTLFGVIATSLTLAFNAFADKIDNEVSELVTEPSEEPGNGNYVLHY